MTCQAVMRVLAKDIDAWADDTWLIDSTPVECGRSLPDREAFHPGGVGRLRVLRQPLALLLGPASPPGGHPSGLPVTFALANPKTDEREVAIDLIDSDPELLAGRWGQTLVADKGYVSAEFEGRLADHGIELVRPAMKREQPRRGARQLRSIRQTIESINATLKCQLSLERHGGHSPQRVATRIVQRLLALPAAIWHNHHAGQPVLRSLTAYDH